MDDFTLFARWFIIAGLVLLGIGALLWLVGRTGLPLGRLPGDIRIESGGFTCFIPLASSILISLLLTLVLNLILRGLGR